MRKSTAVLLAALAAASFGLAPEARADGPDEFRLYIENDFNPFGEGTDRYYTQGMRFEWLSSERAPDDRFLPGITHADWCGLLCGDEAEGARFDSGFAVGQNMYTPAVITIAEPQPFDRPWAGILYGSRIARIGYREPSLDAERQDRIELSLGVVGPASLAKQTQIEWHRLWGFDHPAGWDNQLRNEPVVQLRYETALRWPDHDGGNADFIPRVRANLGNGQVGLEAEATVRLGWNLAGFGVPVIPAAPFIPMDKADGTEEAPKRSKWLASGNLFARAGIKAIAHNIVLDGNTFADNDIRIDRTPFVPEVAAGGELNLVGNFWLSLQIVHRGSEFESRLGGKAPAHEFGALTLAFRKGG